MKTQDFKKRSKIVSFVNRFISKEPSEEVISIGKTNEPSVQTESFEIK
jgi:hypothetical protein